MRVYIVASSPRANKPDCDCPQPDDLVIAADGGANWCAAWGWQPHLIVGDMDSIEPAVADRFRRQGAPFRRYPREKDQTDLELAIGYALDYGAREIVIAAALGGRIDHTLGNLGLLALPSLAPLRVSLVDDAQSIWLVRDRLTVQGQPRDTLSLIPFGGPACGVSVQGVHWPLKEADLPLGPSLGISNRLTAEGAEICVREGMLLAVHIRCQA